MKQVNDQEFYFGKGYKAFHCTASIDIIIDKGGWTKEGEFW